MAGSHVYFLTKRHEVVAVNQRTGTVVWTKATGEPGDETLGSTVLARDDLVMVGDYAVLGLDAATGERRWRFEPEDGYGAGLYLGDAGHGLAFAGSPAGRLYALRTATGRVEWSAQPVAEARTTVFQPVVDGDTVVAGYSTFGRPLVGGVVMVDVRSGRERWRRDFPRRSPADETGFAGGPIVAGDVVIATSGDGRIHAFDRRTGTPRWVLPAVVRGDGRVQDRDWRGLVARGPLLIAGSVTGVVTAFDVRERRERWRFVHPDGGSTALHVSADADTVYVPHLGGRLVALCLRDGRQRWEIGGFSDGFNWAPAVAGRTIYAAASRSGFFALPR